MVRRMERCRSWERWPGAGDPGWCHAGSSGLDTWVGEAHKRRHVKAGKKETGAEGAEKRREAGAGTGDDFWDPGDGQNRAQWPRLGPRAQAPAWAAAAAWAAVAADTACTAGAAAGDSVLDRFGWGVSACPGSSG